MPGASRSVNLLALLRTANTNYIMVVTRCPADRCSGRLTLSPPLPSSSHLVIDAFVDDVGAFVDIHFGVVLFGRLPAVGGGHVRADAPQPASAAAARTSTSMAIRSRVCGVDDVTSLSQPFSIINLKPIFAIVQKRTNAATVGMSALCHKRHRTFGFEMNEAANRGSLANLKVFTPSVRQFDGPSTAKTRNVAYSSPGRWVGLKPAGVSPVLPARSRSARPRR